MSTVKLTRPQILQYINQFIEQENLEKARQLSELLLRQNIYDFAARKNLRRCAAKKDFDAWDALVSRFTQEYCLQGDKFVERAKDGWLYAWSTEGAHNNPALLDVVPSKAANQNQGLAKEIPPRSHNKHVLADYISDIENINDIPQEWARFHEFVTQEDALLLVDSFRDVPDDQLQSALSGAVSGDHLNIVILGAGCSGLLLANALKLGLGDRVDILVIENRVHEPHVKKPYSRNWVTSVLRAAFHGLVSEEVLKASQLYGHECPTDENGYWLLGLPIHILETILLLKNKELGVRFLFQEDYDLSFVESSKTHMIFDATGRGFAAPSDLACDDLQDREIATHNIAAHGLDYKAYGIPHDVHVDVESIMLKAKTDGLYYPYIQGQQIVNAKFKITNFSDHIYRPILDKVMSLNDDRFGYVWRAALHSKINEVMLMFHLDERGYERLSAAVCEKMSLQSFMDQGILETCQMDPRIKEILGFAIAHGEDPDTVSVEPPFLYRPYINLFSDVRNIHGRPVFPVGDSIFNGHSKVGNGLGQHVIQVAEIHDMILSLYCA